MFKVRYTYVERDPRGRRSVSRGVLWIDAVDKSDARRKARTELRATCDAVTIKTVHNTSIGG